MSLDVYLTMDGARQPGGSGIFFREDGQAREITRAEWDEKFPDREPVVVVADEGTDEVFSANVTHNLIGMAEAAGIYKPLWRPEEFGIARAEQLVEPLTKGLALLRAEPERFRAFNPDNGWGSYDGFVPWVEAYLAACKRWPMATVHASR